MPTQKFHVRGLDHKGEAAVAARLRELEGVLFAAVSHSEECAEVEFEDDLITPDEICAALHGLGHPAEPAG